MCRLILDMHLGSGCTYPEKMLADAKIARESLKPIIKSSGITAAVSVQGALVLKICVNDRAKELSLDRLVQAFQPGKEWADPDFPFMSFCHTALRITSKGSFDTLVHSLLDLRDGTLFPNNLEALCNLIHGWVLS